MILQASPTNVHEAMNRPNEAIEETASAHGGCSAACHGPKNDFESQACHVARCHEALKECSKAWLTDVLEQLLPSAEHNDANEQEHCKG